MFRRNVLQFLGLALPAAALAFAGLTGTARAGGTMAKDVLDTASATSDLKTLVELIKAAELSDTLKGKGPFTVFAANDAAFGKMKKEELDNLKKPENRGKLQAILKFHVVEGKHSAAEVAKLKTIKTMNGDAKITTKDKDVMFDNAKIVKTDIECSNGVIHVIDTVARPAEKRPG